MATYHGRRRLPGLREMSAPAEVAVDPAETRFMVLAPGGENPRDELEPGQLSVGIRLTRRNSAIAAIQKPRKSVYRFETPAAIGSRKRTTAWTNAFGSRRYQPRIRLLKPWSKIQRDLTPIGQAVRSAIGRIDLDVFCIESRIRIDGDGASRASSCRARSVTAGRDRSVNTWNSSSDPAIALKLAMRPSTACRRGP